MGALFDFFLYALSFSTIFLSLCRFSTALKWGHYLLFFFLFL